MCCRLCLCDICKQAVCTELHQSHASVTDHGGKLMTLVLQQSLGYSSFLMVSVSQMCYLL